MIVVFVFVSFFLPCLPVLHSATESSMSTPTCPESFSCPGFAPFKYPFYNDTDEQCGLIKVKCNSEGGNIQTGETKYEIVGKIDSSSSFVISNTTFEELVKHESCEALMNNFTSPNPLVYSISINPFLTLFKCTKNTSYAEGMNAYFNQPNYKNHTTCKDHNFYYEYSISNATVPSDLPRTCEVIQLPMKGGLEEKGLNTTTIFSLLSSSFTISISLTRSCEKCHNKGGRCHANKVQFLCLDAKKEEKRKPVALVTALTAGSVTILVVLILCIIRKLKQRKRTKNHPNVENFIKNHQFLDPKRYSYPQVKKMTNSFKVKLGQGGFGSVYKGTLTNGSLVAVKVLSALKGNGEDFINEVATVGRTSHVNIVKLVGFCLEGHQRALIYEFMPNGSLEKFICSMESPSNSQLGWEKLTQIAIGIARGLEYLHSGCNTRILHFDIKPHNILLDKDLCPKISDFGLAKLFPNERSKISMSHMRGTPGYIAPELFSRNFGQVSNKSDVYSYGMMILEMFAGRKDIDAEVDHSSEMYFPHWIYKKIGFNEEELGLHGIVSDEENNMVRKTIIVGLWCIQTNPLNRPTITRVLEMLEGDIELLEIPPKPYMSYPSRPVSPCSPSTSFLSIK